MAAGKHREIHDVQQTKKMIPLITCNTTIGKHVSELVLGVHMFDLDFGWNQESSCQTTNPKQLCGFLKRISSLDFCP